MQLLKGGLSSSKVDGKVGEGIMSRRRIKSKLAGVNSQTDLHCVTLCQQCQRYIDAQ